MIDGELRHERRHFGAWALFGAAVLLGIPFVVVMPVMTAGVAVIAGVVGPSSLASTNTGLRLLAVAAGLLLPLSLYLALSLFQH